MGIGWTQGLISLGFNGLGGNASNQLLLSIDGNFNAASSATSAALATANQWVFFAVSYDGTIGANNVKFYVGDADYDNPITSALSTASANFGELGNVFPTRLSVGAFNDRTQAFDGLIDDIRIYGSFADNSGVLSVAQIENVRASLLPEPSTFLLFSLGGFLVWRRARK